LSAISDSNPRAEFRMATRLMTHTIHPSRRKRFARRAVLALAVLVLVPVGYVVWRYEVHHEAFDSAAWKQADNDRTTRSRMIEDLLSRYDFSGWTRQQVIDLLGDPTGGGQGAGFPQWDQIYLLGKEPPGVLAVDDMALGFSFNTTDRVTKYGVSVN